MQPSGGTNTTREGGGAVHTHSFLGILIDTIQGKLRLPQGKLVRLRDRVKEWLQKKYCTKRDLLSVAGQLQHAATAARPGRASPRRLLDLSSTVRKPHHHLSLNKGARSLWAGQAIEFDTIMLWAACYTAFSGFFRMGELTSPTVTSHRPADCVHVGGCGCR